MRKEIYQAITERLLERLKVVEGKVVPLLSADDVALYADNESAIKHVDLWNHNVEFIEEESAWARPAVFIELGSIVWKPVSGGGEYTTSSRVLLHVVTDWAGGAYAGSPFQAESLEVFDLLTGIHLVLDDFGGSCFDHLRLAESRTNHNHEDIVENVEVFEYRGRKELKIRN